jgi:hypothetical protein
VGDLPAVAVAALILIAGLEFSGLAERVAELLDRLRRA